MIQRSPKPPPLLPLSSPSSPSGPEVRSSGRPVLTIRAEGTDAHAAEGRSGGNVHVQHLQPRPGQVLRACFGREL